MTKKKIVLKQIISFLLVLMLILPPVSEISMAVINAAESVTTDNEAEYVKNGYTVVYKVVSEWDAHKAIEVTIKNTGTKDITNWALSIDNTGNITGLWNARYAELDNDKHIVQCMDYNNTIPAGQSVTFGYTLEGESLTMPNDIFMCAAETELEECFSVEYKVTDDWGTGFQGEIKIINESEQAIEGWKLTFSGNFEVLNYWNCELIRNNNGIYTITHTAWANSIPAGSEYVIGFVGSKTDEEMVITDIKMITTGYSAAGNTGEPETEPTDPVNPTEPEDEIDWEDETDTDDDGIPDVYEIHTFNTDPENPDTDGDGLPDGYEILDIGLNPCNKDSDENGIADDKEDEDRDGLDNLTEYQLGTNPVSEDSDYDGLEDADEIQTYGTSPSNYDTDGDGISDGDEVKLGLDPLNVSTNGVPDGQYTITQTIGADSEVLGDVNTSTVNPYKLSLEVKAAGFAEKNLTVQGSTENAMFQNESYVGELITIDYKDSLKFESLRINFRMEEGVIENELDLFGDETTQLKGIRRFNVFRFVEEVNMLLPIETFHDVENNLVYAETDEDGMYYLVDMEKWLYNLEILNANEQAQVRTLNLESTETVQDEIVLKNEFQTGDYADFLEVQEIIEIQESMEFIGTPSLMALDAALDETEKAALDDRPIDIVFIIQTGNLWSSYYADIAGLFSRVWTLFLEEKYNNMRICVLNRTIDETYFLGENYYTPQWFNSRAEMIKYLPSVKEYIVNEQYLLRDYFDILLNQDIMGYREEAAKFVFDIQLGYNEMPFYYFHGCMSRMKEKGIIFSEMQDMDEAYLEHTESIRNAIESTGGKIFSTESSDTVACVPDFVDEIMSKWVAPQKEFNAIVATGYEKVILQSPLQSTSLIDSDADDLRDWDEVYTELLNWDEAGNIILPSLKYCIENACEKSYIIDGLARFKADNTPAGMPSELYESYMKKLLEETYILPIHSDPTRDDGDGDGYDDNYDMNPLTRYNNGECFILFTDDCWDLYNTYKGKECSDSIKFLIDDIEANVTLIQQCLEYLGYLNMTDEGGNRVEYGTFGGATRCALQLYQLNHGFEPIKYGENNVDINTYSDLVNNAINYGFGANDKDSKEYIYSQYAMKYALNKKYFLERQVVPLMLSKEMEEAGVTVKLNQNISNKEDKYYYCYTVPLNKILYLGEEEFHTVHYNCDYNKDFVNQSYVGIEYIEYANIDKVCLWSGRNYSWLVPSVCNNGKYDIKRVQRWNEWMEQIETPIYFYGSQFPFYYEDSIINAEQFGNILFGAAGNAGGYSLEELQNGGSYYSWVTGDGFDSQDDKNQIKIGYEIYEKSKYVYSYLHE